MTKSSEAHTSLCWHFSSSELREQRGAVIAKPEESCEEPALPSGSVRPLQDTEGGHVSPVRIIVTVDTIQQ